MRVESKIEISAPPALVWEYVSDPSRYLHFMSGITRWEVVGEQAQRASARATGCCCASARPRSAG